MPNLLTSAALRALFLLGAAMTIGSNVLAAEYSRRGEALESEPYFVTGAASGRVSFLGEKQNLPAGERLGGGSTGSQMPNAIDANFTAGYLISPQDQISALYQHALRFAQEDPAQEGASDDSAGGRNFIPPDNIFSANFLHEFSDDWSTQATISYLDTTGIQDPSLSLSYRSYPSRPGFNFSGWGIGARISAPFSERSVKQDKITTVGVNGTLTSRTGRFSVNSRLSTSYSFYRPKEDSATEDDDGTEAYGGTTTEPVYDETDEWDEVGVPDLPDIEVGYVGGRELTRTMFNTRMGFRFSRTWSVSTMASISYAYLETTNSRWKTNWNILSLNAHYGGFVASAAVTVTSPKETQDEATFPDQWGGALTLSYEFPIFGGPHGFSGRRERGF